MQVDDESEPGKATDNMNRLVGRDKVDVVVGTVHSGVAMAMAKIARDTNTLLIIPNAGANDATRAMCAPNIFRTSFTNWQPCFPMGKVMYDAGHRNIMTITWRYAAGEEDVEAFKEGFVKPGGKVTRSLYLPFPEVEFQALITQIAEKKPDAVFAFFAGGGAVKFVKDYAAAGLQNLDPALRAGLPHRRHLAGAGRGRRRASRPRCITPTISTIRPTRSSSPRSSRRPAQDGDVYAVQGYRCRGAARVGLDATKGDFAAKDAMYEAMRAAKIDWPRGPISFSRRTTWCRTSICARSKGGLNRYVSVAHADARRSGAGLPRGVAALTASSGAGAA